MAPKLTKLKSHTISFPGAPPVTVEIVTDLLRTFTPLNVFAPFLLATTFSPLTAGISRLSEAPPSPPLSAPKHRVRGGSEAATKTIKQLGGHQILAFKSSFTRGGSCSELRLQPSRPLERRAKAGARGTPQQAAQLF